MRVRRVVCAHRVVCRLFVSGAQCCVCACKVHLLCRGSVHHSYEVRGLYVVFRVERFWLCRVLFGRGVGGRSLPK